MYWLQEAAVLILQPVDALELGIRHMKRKDCLVSAMELLPVLLTMNCRLKFFQQDSAEVSALLLRVMKGVAH